MTANGFARPSWSRRSPIFELGRRRGYGLDHRADRRFETIGKPVHVRFALLDPEGFDRPRHVAHFVLAVEPGRMTAKLPFASSPIAVVSAANGRRIRENAIQKLTKARAMQPSSINQAMSSLDVLFAASLAASWSAASPTALAN